MEITWYGHSCFRLAERNMATVVTDPYDNSSIGYFPLKLKADIVTISHDAPGHNNSDAVKGTSHVISGPGEFEIGGVFITGVQTEGGGAGKKAKEQTRNTLYVFDYDGLTVAHLGDLKQLPPQTEIEALGTVNVALVPVGGGGGTQRRESRGGDQLARAEHRDPDALCHVRCQSLARVAE